MILFSVILSRLSVTDHETPNVKIKHVKTDFASSILPFWYLVAGKQHFSYTTMVFEFLLLFQGVRVNCFDLTAEPFYCVLEDNLKAGQCIVCRIKFLV